MNGTFLMDTRDGSSERALVREALVALDGARVLLGGLGVGFSLDEALRTPGVRGAAASARSRAQIWQLERKRLWRQNTDRS